MTTNQTDIYGQLFEIVKCARTGSYERATSMASLCLKDIKKLISEPGPYSDESMQRLSRSIESLFAMQHNLDWVAFADILEYEFIPLWRIGFKP